MPANYPRTTSQRFRRNQHIMIEANEKKLERIAEAVDSEGYLCRSNEGAQSLAEALNTHYGVTLDNRLSGEPVSGYYMAVGNRVHYVMALQKEDYNGFTIEQSDICTEGYQTEYDTPQVIINQGTITFTSIADFRNARDAEIANLRHETPGITAKIVQTRYGEIDLNSIDSFRFSPAGDGANFTDKNTYNLALLDRLDSKKIMADFDTFSRVFKQYNDVKTKIEKYLKYTDNHTRMIEASQVSGLDFDVDTHISKPWEAVKATNLFSDQDVVDTVNKGNEIKVSNEFLSKIEFLDDSSPKRYDSQETKDIKIRMRDSDMAYLEDPSSTGRMYIKSSTDKDFFVNGGYFHERFHAQIREQNYKEFRELEDRLEMK